VCGCVCDVILKSRALVTTIRNNQNVRARARQVKKKWKKPSGQLRCQYCYYHLLSSMLDPLWMITSNCIIPVRFSMFSHISNTHPMSGFFFIFHLQRPHPQSFCQLKINMRKNILFDFNTIAVNIEWVVGVSATRGVTYTHQCLITCQFIIGFVFFLQLCIWWQYIRIGKTKIMDEIKNQEKLFLMFSIHPLFVLFPTLIRTLQNTYYKKRTPLL